MVLHGLKLLDGRYVGAYLRRGGQSQRERWKRRLLPGDNTVIPSFQGNGLTPEALWKDGEHYLWFAALYPAADTMEEADPFCPSCKKWRSIPLPRKR